MGENHMPASVVGAKAASVVKGIGHHCGENAVLTGMSGKGITFGLGIGLGSALTFVLAAGGLYLLYAAMRHHMDSEILMENNHEPHS